MKTSLKNWILAVRPWSFPASTMPVILTISYVFYRQYFITTEINWWFGLMALIGVVFLHAGGNLISDYYDFKNQIDREESFGSERLLVQGVFQPWTYIWYGLILIAIGSVMGLWLTYRTGAALLWIGLSGVLGALCYSFLKTRALGDLLIFILYGPMIGLGTAYVLTSQLMWEVLLLNVPVGMLVVNILHANNMRDIKHDAAIHVKSQAMLLGLKGSKIQYVVLALGAYLMVILMNVLGMIHPITLFTLISLPMAIRNIKLMMKATTETLELIKDLDGMTAQLVMVFSMLFSILNVIAYFL